MVDGRSFLQRISKYPTHTLKFSKADFKSDRLLTESAKLLYWDENESKSGGGEFLEVFYLLFNLFQSKHANQMRSRQDAENTKGYHSIGTF